LFFVNIFPHLNFKIFNLQGATFFLIFTINQFVGPQESIILFCHKLYAVHCTIRIPWELSPHSHFPLSVVPSPWENCICRRPLQTVTFRLPFGLPVSLSPCLRVLCPSMPWASGIWHSFLDLHQLPFCFGTAHFSTHPSFPSTAPLLHFSTVDMPAIYANFRLTEMHKVKAAKANESKKQNNDNLSLSSHGQQFFRGVPHSPSTFLLAISTIFLNSTPPPTVFAIGLFY